jgi:hypothetical protein
VSAAKDLHLLTWDHRAQPDWDAFRAVCVALGLEIVVTEVDTGDDQYALIVSRDPVTPEEAQARYASFLATGA